VTGLILALAAQGSVMAASVQVQVQDSAAQPIPDVVVYLQLDAPQTLAKPLAGIEIEQKAKKFLPLVTVVQTGSQIAFPNNDSIRHHIYSFSSPKKFEQRLYSGTAAAPVLFDKAGTVVLGCNIHDTMVAYVHVVDTPYFGKTDAAGKLKIDKVPPGKYTAKAWHYNLPAGAALPEQVVQLKGSDQTLNFSLAVKATPEAKSNYNYP
jgi:plastocyanin